MSISRICDFCMHGENFHDRNGCLVIPGCCDTPCRCREFKPNVLTPEPYRAPDDTSAASEREPQP